MIILHHLNNSRSQRILWLLEHLKLDYKIQYHQRDPKTQLAPQSLKDVHPLGKAPVLEDGELRLAESGAIIDYLARRYGGGELTGASQQFEQTQYQYWLQYPEASLMPPLLLRLVMEKIKTGPMPFFAKPIARSIANKVLKNFVLPNIQSHLDFVEQSLEGKQWILGEAISGADFQLSFPLEACVAKGTVDESRPNILAYVQRIHAQSAYRKALEKGGDYEYGPQAS
ncbi:Glutathione transferase [Saliniradius amylolyticus]|uniref:glutathione transferase n=1 Tax=Saliniradius amylolyticus TaxID=2183582 RepID=A0A2S2E1F5_9ALTE|nr:glutathione S-transferase [Saliniradius amylolyticus]AWL11481.1 Glutathione transferase [Saliniradius amylolyticus]